MENQMTEFADSTMKENVIYKHSFLTSPLPQLFIEPGTGQIVDVNQAAINFYGYGMLDLLRMTIFSLGTGDRQALANYLAYNGGNNNIQGYHCRQRLRDGKLRDVDLYSGSLLPNGLINCFIVDVTERSTLERTLRFSHELRRKSELFNGIIYESREPSEREEVFTELTGADTNTGLFVCVILSEAVKPADDTVNTIKWSKETIIDALSQMAGCIPWDSKEGIGLLCRSDFRAADWQKSKEFALQVKNVLQQGTSSRVGLIGVSNIYDNIQDLAKMYRQALNAAMALRSLKEWKGSVLHYCEAGIFQFLPQVLDWETSSEFVEDTLGKLLRYDKMKGAKLLATLEVVLNCTSMQQAGKRMFLHPKTVVFRKQRIENILNVSLDDFETRLTLAMAIKLYRLRQTGTSGGWGTPGNKRRGTKGELF